MDAHAAHTPVRYGRYEILFPLAKGGMGSVYVAQAVGAAEFRKTVALKLIRPEYVQNPRFVDRFLNEGRVAANISSPYVAGTLDLDQAEDGSLYLVSEFILGENLRQLLVESRKHQDYASLSIRLRILTQAAQGLRDIHEAKNQKGDPLGLVHRDLSPHNIMVGADGRARIVDFGVARGGRNAQLTETGEVVGKLGYMSPEQVVGEGVDQRSDLFSFGVLAWETLTGKRLFRGKTEWESLKRIIELPIPELSSVVPDVPIEIGALIRAALTREPNKRLQSAAALHQGIEKAALKTIGLAEESEVAAWVRRNARHRIQQIEEALREGHSVAVPKMPPTVDGNTPRQEESGNPYSESQSVRDKNSDAPTVTGTPARARDRARGHGDVYTQTDAQTAGGTRSRLTRYWERTLRVYAKRRWLAVKIVAATAALVFLWALFGSEPTIRSSERNARSAQPRTSALASSPPPTSSVPTKPTPTREPAATEVPGIVSDEPSLAPDPSVASSSSGAKKAVPPRRSSRRKKKRSLQNNTSVATGRPPAVDPVAPVPPVQEPSPPPSKTAVEQPARHHRWLQDIDAFEREARVR